MLRSVRRLIQVPDKLALFGLMRGMQGQMKLMTAAALLRLGAMPKLREARTVEEVADACEVRELVLLHRLLKLGVRLKLLRRKGDRFQVRGRLAQALAREGENPVASMLLEVTSYHHDVFARLPERLRGEEPRDYLAEFGGVVAVSSRIMEPWVNGYSDGVLSHERPKRILDLGCGSGRFLVHCASLHADHRGFGLELDPKAAEVARASLEQAGCADRFSIVEGDMREPSTWPEESFDLITAHQNVYYFSEQERLALFEACRARLGPQGKLIMVTPTSGGPMSDYFDLVLGSTAGCTSLPSVEQLQSELGRAGFARVQTERLIPGDSVFGLCASHSANSKQTS